MGPETTPVNSDETLPERVAVVIVGGGIIGVCAAFALARKGVSVALCEKGRVAAEQSSRNWGWCRKMMRDPRELPLIIESLRMWGEMDRTVEAPTGFARSGIMYVSSTEADLAFREAWLKHAFPWQLDSRMVGPDEVAALMPGATKRYLGGLYTPSDGRAEPQLAGPAIAAAARRLGASIHQSCAVRGLDMAAGKVTGVVTEKGRIACDSVIVAGGAWSRLFLKGAGLRLPQLKVRSSALRTGAVDVPIAQNTWTSEFAIRKRQDGGYTIANGHANISEITPDSFVFFRDFLPALRAERKSIRLRLNRRFVTEWREAGETALDRPTVYERVRILDPGPTAEINNAAWRSVKEAIPKFRETHVAQQWAGMIDVMPDAIPVISPAETTPGLFIATGFSGHGFGIGPAAGRLVADLVTGDPPIVDPAPFRFSRFSDGSTPLPFVPA